MWKVPELTAAVIRDKQNHCINIVDDLHTLSLTAFFLNITGFLLYLGKQKWTKRKACLEKEGENLSGSQTVRAEHAEGEGRRLLHCVSVLSKQDELFKTEHEPSFVSHITSCLKKTFAYGMKDLFKSKNKVIFMTQLLGGELHPDLPSTLSGKLKSPKQVFAKPWNWVFTKVCGLLAFQAWSSTSSHATGFLSRYHCYASHWQPCAEVSSFLLKLPLVAVIVGICPLGWSSKWLTPRLLSINCFPSPFFQYSYTIWSRIRVIAPLLLSCKLSCTPGLFGFRVLIHLSRPSYKDGCR